MDHRTSCGSIHFIFNKTEVLEISPAEMLFSLYYVKFSELLTNLQLTKVQPQPNHFTSDYRYAKVNKYFPSTGDKHYDIGASGTA